MTAYEPTPELAELRDQLSTLAPRHAPPTPDLADLEREIGHRARFVTTRRRWMVVSTIGLLLGLGGGFWLASRAQPDAPAPPGLAQVGSGSAKGVVAKPSHLTPPGRGVSAEDGAITWHNRSTRDTVVDLGLGIGRLLLRPGTRARYRPAEQQLSLERGNLVAHLLAGAPTLTVVSAATPRTQLSLPGARVGGTLVTLDATLEHVVVYEGDVLRQRDAQETRLPVASAAKRLPAFELRWLGVALASGEPKAPSTRSKPAARPAKKIPTPTAPLPADPELATLFLAQRALAAGRNDEASTLLARYQRRFPQGRFGQEAALLELRALAASRRRKALRRAAQRFLRLYPHSVKRKEIEALLRATP